jgi:hypothetical protein
VFNQYVVQSKTNAANAANPNWRHDTATWFRDLLLLAALTAAGLLGTLWALKRRDIHVLAEAPKAGAAGVFRRQNAPPPPPPPNPALSVPA